MKRFLVLVLALLMLATVFTGCKKAPEKITLTVWGSQEDQVMLGEMIDAFKAAHPEKEYTITLGVVGEPDAKARYLEDPAAAADVFALPNDQILDLVKAGALYEITRDRKTIEAENGAGAVNSAIMDGKLYAYPMTADNGYFLYYDKSVISDEQAASLDGILKAANDASKKVFMDISNGWYIASFFLGGGCTLTVDADGNQLCDFNNDKGLAVAEALKAFTADKAFLTGDDAVLKAGFADGSVVAGVSGAWNSGEIEASLGANYGATKLPTFTMSGNQVQMSSFAGYKLIGVNSQTKAPTDAMDLALWLTNTENQLKRFETRGAGPSNIAAASDSAVKENLAIAALALQGQFATSQNNVLGNYWSPAEAFGTALEAKDYSMSLQEMLDALVAQATAK